MDHYLDIDLLPDLEFAPVQLMSVLYAKLHRGLVGLESIAIGISFPAIDQKRLSLGSRLRLHGSVASLALLMSKPWLCGMSDHVQLSAIQPVPDYAKHCRISRVQVKSSVERLRRRLMKRHNLSAEEAHQRIPDIVERRLDLPFITLCSQSTRQYFNLFFRHHDPQPHAILGHFNTYGLSAEATVPWF